MMLNAKDVTKFEKAWYNDDGDLKSGSVRTLASEVYNSYHLKGDDGTACVKDSASIHDNPADAFEDVKATLDARISDAQFAIQHELEVQIFLASQLRASQNREKRRLRQIRLARKQFSENVRRLHEAAPEIREKDLRQLSGYLQNAESSQAKGE